MCFVVNNATDKQALCSAISIAVNVIVHVEHVPCAPVVPPLPVNPAWCDDPSLLRLIKITPSIHNILHVLMPELHDIQYRSAEFNKESHMFGFSVSRPVLYLHNPTDNTLDCYTLRVDMPRRSVFYYVDHFHCEEIYLPGNLYTNCVIADGFTIITFYLFHR